MSVQLIIQSLISHWLNPLTLWIHTFSVSPCCCCCFCCCLCVRLPAPADQPCTVVAEPHGGHAQSRRVGHEGEAVPHRSGDQDVGHRLLRHPEAVQRRDPQVSSGNLFVDAQLRFLLMTETVQQYFQIYETNILFLVWLCILKIQLEYFSSPF